MHELWGFNQEVGSFRGDGDPACLGCCINQEELDAVSRVIDEVTNRFYQSFSTLEVDGALAIECNEIAAAKLIPRLEDELRGRRPDVVICFEGKPE
jgi:hypothetical protein